ncbi:hypothetical protein GIB67_031267 [Kingdonia uniflora]|uniref:Calponin-homology (CH) domain-containing protein n=1 Tax=Kingdonia uniflora TaxID=39325 RepID=A0A7J7NCC9_9MAGN|nr:hypothetical protein GIB67_031267 [Kingdonia uniflora]
MGRAAVLSSRAVSSDVRRVSVETSFRELDDVFLQTQTRIWLGEVLGTRLDDEIPVADLLADGKLLYQVSKVIWKMLLKNSMKLRYSKSYFGESVVSGKRSGRYMPYSNVDSFLKICQILGLSGIDLFSPSDVVEKRDIRRVCMCIRSVSKKARFKDVHVPDFDIVTYTVSMPKDMVKCIRRSLEKSHCRSTSAIESDPSMVSRPNGRKKHWGGADYVKHGNLHSEESNDAESSYHTEHPTKDNIWFNEGDSNSTFSQPFTDFCMKINSQTSCVDKETMKTPLSTSENFGFSPVDRNLGNASVLEDSGDNYTSEGDYISCQSGLSNFVSFNRESGTVFYRLSSAHKNSRCELGRGFFEENEDTEVSSTISVNSSSDKFESLDYEDLSEAEDSNSICGYESQDVLDYETSVDSSTNETAFGMKFQDIGSSTKPRLNVKVFGGTPSKHDIITTQNLNDSSEKDHFVSKVDITCETRQSRQEKVRIEEEVKVLVGCSRKTFAETSSELFYDPELDSRGLVITGNEQWNLFDANSTTLDQSMDCLANLDTLKEISSVPINGNDQSRETVSLPHNCISGSVSHDYEKGGTGSSGYFCSDLEPSVGGASMHSCGSKIENEPCKTAEYSENIEEGHKSRCSLDENGLHVIQLACMSREDAESCLESKDKHSENHEKLDRDKTEAPKHKTYKTVLLKSVAGGMTFIGAFFLFFHLRRKSSQDKFNETSIPSKEVVKARSGEIKRQQRGKVGGVYPGDKLRF